MPRDSAFSHLPFPFRDLEVVTNSYTRNTKHVVNGLNISLNLGCDFVTRSRNFTHFQCAGESAEQSTTNRTDHVVQSSWDVLVRFNPVELFNSTMDTESDRMLKSFKVHFSNRPLDAIYSHPAGMDNF